MTNIFELREAAKNILNNETILHHLYGKPFNYHKLKYFAPDWIILGEYIIKKDLLNLKPPELLENLESQSECFLIVDEQAFQSFEFSLTIENNESIEKKIDILKIQLEKIDLENENKKNLMDLIIKIATEKDDEIIKKSIDNILNLKLIKNYTHLYPLIQIFNSKVNKNFYKQKFRKEKGLLK
ncbi:hypothetical protein [Fusobacterium sp.]|uniref:hypothetical protein n=1 Tax=Fusobacterium sp. TaxID=68766 RepID=UPI002E78FCA5|nr:hypothetical protein [Fusobacterium sp.]MEE1475351.1 hypothetical protein [Fusobacterium sp.]